MFQASRSRLAHFAAALAGAAILLHSSAATEATAASRVWPSQVIATYKIAFNGFDIGRFRFDARVDQRAYVLTGNAEISAFLGVFKWRGVTRSEGLLAGNRAAPSSYAFDYQSNARTGNVRMGFRQGDVAMVSADPPLPTAPDEVPLERVHLSGVLDPLSAVMMLTRPSTGAPCAQRLKVFDGKQRFDLALTERGERRLAARRSQEETLTVCGVRYRPVAGFRRGGETDALARSEGIEIAFRRIAEADLFVPQAISVPTGVGAAVLTLERLEARTANNDQVAFVE
ncbi:MAG: DUF3108 domain-containing protein [Hyphomicrobiaceae bacterium]